MVSHCMDTICPRHGYSHVLLVHLSFDGYLGCFHSLVVAVVVAQSCLTLTPWTVGRQAPLSMGILWARTLEWVAIPFSRGSSQPRGRTQVSCIADSLPSELHFLAIMNNSAMKISFCVNTCFQFSLLEIELLDHIVTLCLTFWGNARLFSKLLVNFTFLATVCEGSSLPVSLPTLVIIHPFYYSHPNECEVVFHCHLICMKFLINFEQGALIFILSWALQMMYWS